MHFTFTTAGESHGRALIATIEGLPAGLLISLGFINHELWRRQQGYGRGGRMKIETDTVQILTGVRHGETLGGPIALIDEQMPVVVLTPMDHWFEKTVSNMQEVAARGGQIIVIGPKETAEKAAVQTVGNIDMPDMAPEFSALAYAIPVQLLAYYTASIMGKDVDQPRNLAKSVTVE